MSEESYKISSDDYPGPPSHTLHTYGAPALPVFSHHTSETSGGSGRFGDVMITYMPPFLQTMAEMVTDCNHYRFFLHALKNMGRPGYEAITHTHTHTHTHSMLWLC